MDNFIKAVTEDTTNILAPVYKEVFTLRPIGEEVKEETLQKIAINVNKKLGYELFENYHRDRLLLDFTVITRMAQLNMLKTE